MLIQTRLAAERESRNTNMLSLRLILRVGSSGFWGRLKVFRTWGAGITNKELKSLSRKCNFKGSYKSWGKFRILKQLIGLGKSSF